MSVNESSNSPASREEALTILYHLEKLFEWITKNRDYSPLRTIDMIVFLNNKARENPDADLLEEVQAFICEYTKTQDLFSAVDSTAGKLDEFEKVISFLEGRRISDIAALTNEKSLEDTVREFQQHVTSKLGKVLRVKEVKKENIFAKKAPRGVKAIRNNDKK